MKLELALFSVLTPTVALALSFDLPTDGSDLVGEVQTVEVTQSITLQALGRQYGIGPREMEAANPGLLKGQSLPAGASVVIPSRFILPDIREGIVINSAEYRLYYFPEGGGKVLTFPVAIGKVGVWLPHGDTIVERKATDPWWRPTPNQRAANPRLPRAMGPGPNNPLGKYVLYLTMDGIRIHGTTKPDSVGTRASFGCFRMDPKDIEELWPQVPVGTKVKIINEPVRFGTYQGKVYVKMMPPIKAGLLEAQYTTAFEQVAQRGVTWEIEPAAIKKMPKDAIPTFVGNKVTPIQ